MDALYAARHPLGCDAPSPELVNEIEQLLRELFSPSEEQQATCLTKLEDLGVSAVFSVRRGTLPMGSEA